MVHAGQDFILFYSFCFHGVLDADQEKKIERSRNAERDTYLQCENCRGNRFYGLLTNIFLKSLFTFEVEIYSFVVTFCDNWYFIIDFRAILEQF